MKDYKWLAILVSVNALILTGLIIPWRCPALGAAADGYQSLNEDITPSEPANSTADMIIYQIYPRSFRDSNGDGIGDLPGIIDKLDYLQGLGVNTIWFSPFFKSPQADFGYDVSDYYDISPEYGTMADFNRLLREMHARNMKMVLDLPLNHTSIEHPWFKESASSKDNPKRDWYIWRDGKKPGGKAPPNNWKAIPGGSAWRYFKNTDQWVYFHFLPFQPDLNYRNPAVIEEMFNVMRFWLDKGVDGFRLDILHAIYEDENLTNDSFSWAIFPSDTTTASLFTAHKYDLNLPETYDFAMELRTVMNEYQPERVLLGEVFGSIEELRRYYGNNDDGLQMVFLFEFTSTPFKPEKYAEILNRIDRAIPPPLSPTYVLSNHDRVRFITRLKNNTDKVKIAATMQLTLRGVPIIYYGEEIGMPNSDFKLSTSKDPIGRKYGWVPGFLSKLLGLSLTRDGCRTPMQWDNQPGAGFSTNPAVEPWLKVSDSYQDINVLKENQDTTSVLNCYKRLLKIRNENEAIRAGSFELIELGSMQAKCLAYRRTLGTQEEFIYLNFSTDVLQIPCPMERPGLQFSTLVDRTELETESPDNLMTLHPLEGIIFGK